MSEEGGDWAFKPLTIAEASKAVGRSRRLIDKWIAAGQLRTVRLEDPPQRVVIAQELFALERTKRNTPPGRPPKNPDGHQNAA